MHLIAISRVKNEIDIIEAFIRHTLALVDHLLIMDHDSTDGTLEVIRELKEQGLSIEIREHRTLHQKSWADISGMMKTAVEMGADWIFPLDADEFLVTESKETLINALNLSPGQLPLQYFWKTYIPTASDTIPQDCNPVIRIQHRLLAEGSLFPKVIVPRKLAQHPNSRLSQGNHFVFLNDYICEANTIAGTHLGHFPIRSVGQYANKVITAWLRDITSPDTEVGYHYEQPFQLLKKDFRTFSNNLQQLAMTYSLPPDIEFRPEIIFEPFPYRRGPLTLTRPMDNIQTALLNSLSFGESLARGYKTYATAIQAKTILAGENQQVPTKQLMANLLERSFHPILKPYRKLRSIPGRVREKIRFSLFLCSAGELSCGGRFSLFFAGMFRRWFTKPCKIKAGLLTGRITFDISHDSDWVEYEEIFAQRAYQGDYTDRIVIDLGTQNNLFSAYAHFHGAKKVFSYDATNMARPASMEDVFEFVQEVCARHERIILRVDAAGNEDRIILNMPPTNLSTIDTVLIKKPNLAGYNPYSLIQKLLGAGFRIENPYQFIPGVTGIIRANRPGFTK